jgi:mono/diheme cytochrome c family protein
VSSLEPASRRLLRLVIVPTCLFLLFAGAAFTLAKLHLAKPGTPSASGAAKLKLGEARRGEALFTQRCAGCHGSGGTGGSGPRLAGARISIAAAKAQIDNGGGVMPASLVSGRAEEDVLAYLNTILAAP